MSVRKYSKMREKKKNRDTWLIIGCSEKLCELLPHISEVCENYTTIGLDVIGAAIWELDYWLATDKEVFRNCVNSQHHIKWFKTICPVEFLPLLRTDQEYCSQEYLLTPYLSFTSEEASLVQRHTGRLLNKYHSVIPAINFAILHGAKRVVLMGVEFTANQAALNSLLLDLQDCLEIFQSLCSSGIEVSELNYKHLL